MKKNAKPELTPSWWNSNKPKAWDDGRLEMALQAYVKGLSRFEKEKSGEAMGVAIDLLDQVEKHASASVKVATEKPKKPSKDYDAEDFSNTAEALKKFDSCIKEERTRIQALVGEESEEEEEENEEGVLLDEDAYRKYLKKKMKKIESKPCVFALALSKPSNPEEHRFLFHKTKNGKKLGMEILDEVKSLEMKKLTWGIASADPDSKSTLVLMLEHKQLPGMIKQGNKFLKAFKPLPFDTIKLLSADGKELQDLPDEEDEEAAAASGTDTQSEKPDLLARLNALTGRIKDFALVADLAGKKAGSDLEAKKAALEPKNRLLTLVRDCKGLIGTNDEQAEAMLKDIEDILSTKIVEPKATASSPEKKPDLMGRLNALTSRIKEFAVAADLAATNAGADQDAKKIALAPKDRLLTLVRDFKGSIGKNDEQAEAMLADIEAILNSKQDASSATHNTSLDSLRLEYESKLSALQPKYARALKEMLGDTSKFRTDMAYVTEQAEAGVFGNAIKAIDRLSQAIQEAIEVDAIERQANDSLAASAEEQASEENRSGIAFTECRLAWDSTRKSVQSQLQDLERAILAACEKHNQDPEREFDVDLKAMARKTKSLYEMLEKLDTRLIDKLDEALSAQEAPVRNKHQRDAAAIVAAYRSFVDSDPLLLDIDENGFTTTKIRGALVEVLDNLASRL